VRAAGRRMTRRIGGVLLVGLRRHWPAIFSDCAALMILAGFDLLLWCRIAHRAGSRTCIVPRRPGRKLSHGWSGDQRAQDCREHQSFHLGSPQRDFVLNLVIPRWYEFSKRRAARPTGSDEWQGPEKAC